MTARSLALLTALLCWLAPALARADDYVDFDPTKATKAVSAPLFVIIAYSAIWLVVLLFAVALFRRQRAIADELAQAQARLDELVDDERE
jgi:CcmD family protein